jgi:hypothetical protein
MYAVTCYHTDIVQGSSQRLWQTQHFAAAEQAHNARHHLAALAEAAMPLLSEWHQVPSAEEKETQQVRNHCAVWSLLRQVACYMALPDAGVPVVPWSHKAVAGAQR